MIKRELVVSIISTGGAETTVEVKVVQYCQPGSINDGGPTLLIVQNSLSQGVLITNRVHISPETLKAILAWAEEGQSSDRRVGTR